ncbi:hypothetical protein HAX54_021695 [Datura stramonium]|uniref:DUF4283 domain-containing protein n=1 Tax=Datura stramonium TaxID=4076 RepID=A0ABS8UT30_DATST|nr:hypothetical protein [Datura stramonium]
MDIFKLKRSSPEKAYTLLFLPGSYDNLEAVMASQPSPWRQAARIEIQELQNFFQSIYELKLVGWLARPHVLIRFHRYGDFLEWFRIFPWSIDYNPKSETSKAFVWISFPSLPPALFAKKTLLLIASAAGKPIAIDKETQDRSKPSTTRVEVELISLDKLPQATVDEAQINGGKFQEDLRSKLNDKKNAQVRNRIGIKSKPTELATIVTSQSVVETSLIVAQVPADSRAFVDSGVKLIVGNRGVTDDIDNGLQVENSSSDSKEGLVKNLLKGVYGVSQTCESKQEVEVDKREIVCNGAGQFQSLGEPQKDVKGMTEIHKEFNPVLRKKEQSVVQVKMISSTKFKWWADEVGEEDFKDNTMGGGVVAFVPYVMKSVVVPRGILGVAATCNIIASIRILEIQFSPASEDHG